MNYTPLSKEKSSLIIDTDIGPDCDDAGALAILFHLQKEFGFNIPAVINCTSNPFGCGAVDAIASFCHAGPFKIGLFSSREFLSDKFFYNKSVSEKFSPAFCSGALEVSDSAEVYREVLSSSPDRGTVICAIGQFNAVAEALKKYPELFNKKVRAMVSMSGAYPGGEKEYNIECAPEDAKYVLSHANFPIFFSGLEVGFELVTGFSNDDERPDNPIWLSYNLFPSPGNSRFSWDLTAVHFAVTGESEFYSLSEPFYADVNPDGSENITFSPGGPFRYIILNPGKKEELENYFNKILRSN